MVKTKPRPVTDKSGLRFNNTPLPRPSLLTAYAADGGWSDRTRLNVAAAVIFGYAATRPTADGFKFPDAAYPAFDFSRELYCAIAGGYLESQWPDVAEARSQTLAEIVVRPLKKSWEFVAILSSSGLNPAVTQYAEAVCKALLITPTAHWLTRPRDVCRYAIARLYLVAGKLPATEEM